ncbi:MAG: hypothetical protein ACI9P9_000391 [Patescibacteria group bacterium]|jgi:hypothetical protein
MFYGGDIMVLKLPIENVRNESIAAYLEREVPINRLEDIAQRNQNESDRLEGYITYIKTPCSQKKIRAQMKELKPEIDNLLGVSNSKIPRVHTSGKGVGRIFSGSLLPLSFALCGTSTIGVVSGSFPLYATTGLFLTQIASGITALALLNDNDKNPSYLQLSKEICIPSNYYEGLLPFALAHEYTHFQQQQHKITMRSGLRTFIEGHVMSTAGKVVEEFYKNTPDKRYAAEAFSERDKSSIITLDHVSKIKSRMSSAHSSERLQYALGFSFFELLEEEHGPEVYSEVLKPEFLEKYVG